MTTGHPETLDPGRVEIDLFSFFSRARQLYADDGSIFDDGRDRNSDLFVGSVTVGLIEDLDVTVVGGASSLIDSLRQTGGARVVQGPARGGGLTDVELDFRWRFYRDEEQDLSVALIAGPSSQNPVLDLGNSIQLGDTFLAWETGIVARKNWGRFTLNGEIFYGFPLENYSPSQFHELGGNIAAGYQLFDWLQPVFELNYIQLRPQGDRPVEITNYTAGFVVSPTDWWNVFLGFQDTLAGRNTEDAQTFIFGTAVTF